MVPHSSILAWKIPWTEDPGWLQYIGSKRVRHDCSDYFFTHVFIVTLNYFLLVFYSSLFLFSLLLSPYYLTIFSVMFGSLSFFFCVFIMLYYRLLVSGYHEVHRYVVYFNLMISKVQTHFDNRTFLVPTLGFMFLMSFYIFCVYVYLLNTYCGQRWFYYFCVLTSLVAL